jgi:predicted nuclease of predicted toxin-antitoxin system
MKLIIDENMPPGWRVLLAASGIEAIEWSALGPADAPDTEIIAYAQHNTCVILTRDLDFGTHLAQLRLALPSVIQVRTNDTNPVVIGQQVVEAILANQSNLTTGALLTVEAWSKPRTRIAMLPISARDSS